MATLVQPNGKVLERIGGRIPQLLFVESCVRLAASDLQARKVPFHSHERLAVNHQFVNEKNVSAGMDTLNAPPTTGISAPRCRSTEELV
jgi:hypothetical protein